MALVVTGGAGFIGATLIEALNQAGHEDIIVVEAWDHPESWRTLQTLTFRDLIHLQAFRQIIKGGSGSKQTRLAPADIDAIFHLGACTDTLETRMEHLLSVNTEFSRELLTWSGELRVPLIYASSASVYGSSQDPSRPTERAEHPLNAYAFSKLLFDQHLRRTIKAHPAPVYGFRFFNVYGKYEAHKGRMASMVYQLGNQALAGGPMRLFSGFGGYSDGGHRRDFVSAHDVVRVLLKTLGKSDTRGIFDLGTGGAVSFLELAQTWQRHLPSEITFFECPERIQKAYQSYTCADIEALSEAGLAVDFHSLDQGISQLAGHLKSATNQHLNPMGERCS